jgi:hypothetical protein
MSTGVVLLVIGLASLVITFGARERARRHLRSWPAAAGAVNELVERDGPTVSYRGNFTQQVIQAAIYTYRVDGVAHAGEVQNAYTKSAGVRNQGFIDKYPVGKSLEVHYDPANPSKSVVSTGWESSFFAILIGVALTALGVVMIVSQR